MYITKKTILTVIFSCLCSFAFSANVHALLLHDNDHDISKAGKHDVQHMQEFLGRLSSSLHKSLHIKELAKKELTQRNIISWIQKTPCTKDDILVIYYTGHGARTKKLPSKWPLLYFTEPNELMPSEMIIKEVQRKQYHLCLVLLDCCNNVSKHLSFKSKPPMNHFSIAPQRAVDELFNRKSGFIFACAAKPGMVSHCHPKHGSLFTTSFLINIEEEFFAPKPSWKHVTQGIHQWCKEATPKKNSQVPFFEINLK